MNRQYLFLTVAGLLFCVSGYHFYGLFDSSLRPGYPPLRHLVFVVVNLLLAYFMIKRSKYVLPFLAVLVMQQLYSHGGSLMRHYSEEHALNYIDLFVVIFLPSLLFAYVYDVVIAK